MKKVRIFTGMKSIWALIQEICLRTLLNPCLVYMIRIIHFDFKIIPFKYDEPRAKLKEACIISYPDSSISNIMYDCYIHTYL